MQSHHFTLELQTLNRLFDLHQIRVGTSSHVLQINGGVEWLTRQLKTDINMGIDDTNQTEKKRRKHRFGDNKPIIRYRQTLWDMILDNFKDTVMKILIVCTFVSIALGIYTKGIKEGWFEGISILVAIGIIATVNTVTNYQKSKQFENLFAISAVKKINLIRNGIERQTTDDQLLVGDIIRVETGQIMSIDGIIVENNGIICDESLITGESKQIKKNQAKLFMISGSKILEGSGKVLVLSVGVNTNYGKIQASVQYQDTPTPLQTKLQAIVLVLSKIGLIFAVLIFLALILRYSIKCAMWKHPAACFIRKHTIDEVISDFLNAVAILVMAIPEGLPVAVSIALAFSIDKMKEQHNLVRYLGACQTMGGANNICSDKTGTLTTNVMTVTHAYIQQKLLDIDDQHLSPIISKEYQQILIDSICQNTHAMPQKIDNKFAHVGNKTQCALLEMLMNMGYDYQKIRKINNVVNRYQFSSATRRMTTIYKDSNTNKIYVFAKGATQTVLPKCSYYIDKNSQISKLDSMAIRGINQADASFSTHCLRTLILAYKEITQTDSEQTYEKELTFIGLFSIKDPLKKNVRQAVQLCKDASIRVRMITGDSKDTSISIAKEAGILDNDYDISTHPYAVMEGKQFFAFVAGIKNKGTKDQTVGDIHNFALVARDLVVLARSSPEDKYILTAGLIQMGEVVAVTGDGTNDAPALKKADIGFAMGISGTEVAKEASGIILLDDNFSSILTAVKWGRNIFMGVRKFVQFQKTIHVIVLVITLAGAIAFDEPPFNTLQILWINLIMDTFGALALATQPPTDKVFKDKPHSRHQSMVTPQMTFLIMTQSVFQIVLLGSIMIFGSSVFGVPNSFEVPLQHQSEATNKLSAYFFSVFVYLQLFNQLNCRKLQHNDYNIFSGLQHHPTFFVVFVLSFGVQTLLIQFGGNLVRCAPLTLTEHLTCILIGSFTIPYCLLSYIIVLLWNRMWILPILLDAETLTTRRARLV